MGQHAKKSIVLATTCNFSTSGVVLYVGGNYNNHNQNYGLFYMNGNNNASNSNNNIGSRIHYIVTAHSKAVTNPRHVVPHPLVKIC